MKSSLSCYDLLPSINMKASVIWSIWVLGVALESLLLVRAVTSPWLRRYPFFFAYVSSVFLQEISLLVIYVFKFEYYASSYWYGEFTSVLLGCGVSWEIFRLVLGQYPGAGRMARNVLLFALIMVCTKGAVDAWNGSAPWPTTAVELERNLRAIQALLLFVLAVLTAYYAIPMGRNIKGIFVGYGLFIGTSVMTLTLSASLGATFQTAWLFLQPFCYAAVLGIWCTALWKYEDGRQLQSRAKIEEDYQSLVLVTRKGLHQARSFLGKSMRP
ncbi:MAG TPA: hypothetical protein VIW23_13775 [Candidatus Acidoferrum sp.]